MMNKEVTLRKALVETNVVDSLWEYNLNIPGIEDRIWICRNLLMRLFQITH